MNMNARQLPHQPVTRIFLHTADQNDYVPIRMTAKSLAKDAAIFISFIFQYLLSFSLFHNVTMGGNDDVNKYFDQDPSYDEAIIDNINHILDKFPIPTRPLNEQFDVTNEDTEQSAYSIIERLQAIDECEQQREYVHTAHRYFPLLTTV